MNPTVRTKNATVTPIASATTALASNPARVGFIIQNLGTNPLFVLMGAGASTSVFHKILKGSGVQDDGSGASLDFNGNTVYNGVISIAGTSPRYTIYEIAP